MQPEAAMKWRIVLVVVLFVLVASLPSHAVVEIETFGIVTTDPELDLFTRIGPSRPPEPLAAIGAIEEWPVDVNLAHLRNLPESIILNLPGQEPELLARQRSRSRTNGGGSSGRAVVKVAARC